MDITDIAPDEYKIEVVENPGRRGGYRVQVHGRDHRGGWMPMLAESGHLPWRRVGLWRATWWGAFHAGMSEAYEMRDACPRTGPFVVYHGDDVVADERAGIPGAPR